MISIKLMKLKFEAQSNRNNSISTYATRFCILALKSTCYADKDWPLGQRMRSSIDGEIEQRTWVKMTENL
jgi:hypothetical protein